MRRCLASGSGYPGGEHAERGLRAGRVPAQGALPEGRQRRAAGAHRGGCRRGRRGVQRRRLLSLLLVLLLLLQLLLLLLLQFLLLLLVAVAVIVLLSSKPRGCSILLLLRRVWRAAVGEAGALTRAGAWLVLAGSDQQALGAQGCHDRHVSCCWSLSSSSSPPRLSPHTSSQPRPSHVLHHTRLRHERACLSCVSVSMSGY